MTLAVGPNSGMLVHGAPGEGYYNEWVRTLRALDFFANPVVTSASTLSPPGSPTDGVAYILPGSGTLTGAWVGNANKIARWSAALAVPAWEFITPKAGWATVFNLADGKRYQFNGTIWYPVSAGTPRTVTGSTTLEIGDAENVLITDSGSANNVTVPPNSSVAFPIGTLIEVWQKGAGQSTFVQGAGVTITVNAVYQKRLDAQGSTGRLRKVATDTWALSGDLDI